MWPYSTSYPPPQRAIKSAKATRPKGTPLALQDVAATQKGAGKGNKGKADKGKGAGIGTGNTDRVIGLTTSWLHLKEQRNSTDGI